MKKVFGVDWNIFLLGLVSFFTDVSSEMIFSVFSIFVVTFLGFSTFLLGLMEGLSDFASSSLDYVSGFLSDKLGKKKFLTLSGYGFSTLAKSVLVIANSTVIAFSFRVLERLGKSFRGPPRDSWIASLSNKESKGYSFGFHKTLDKAGAVVGPLIAYWLLSSFGQTLDTFHLLFIVALISSIIAVALLFLIPDKVEKPKKKEFFFSSFKNLSKNFKHYLLSASIFSLAYFSFGFLMLKAYLIGFQIKDVVLLYALFNFSFVLFAIPIGKLGDWIGRKKIIALSYVLYFIMSLGFVFATTKLEIILLFILFGLFYSIDEAQSKAYITDLEAKKKGVAIGSYNFVTGLVYLPASVIAGLLWMVNPSYAFAFAGLTSITALIVFTL
ncbi:Multidrug resistance protein MdtH [uncultured archaeon]|nr:Multidrug resistance protein MdtH [uncultured archaeon]